jgi:DNA-binding response OmpR family regulator
MNDQLPPLRRRSISLYGFRKLGYGLIKPRIQVIGETSLSANILIVDDEENICHYLMELFQLEGWVAEAAYDGYEGVKNATDRDYDVIIMDIMMPRMTGIEATREIVRRKPNSKIVVITGAPYRKHAQEALDNGAKLFIKKPFSSEKIVQAVRDLLGLLSPTVTLVEQN